MCLIQAELNVVYCSVTTTRRLCDTRSHWMSVAEERLPSGECPTPVPDPDVRHWQRWGAKLGITPKERGTIPRTGLGKDWHGERK